jgi:hypothetical protein
VGDVGESGFGVERLALLPGPEMPLGGGEVASFRIGNEPPIPGPVLAGAVGENAHDGLERVRWDEIETQLLGVVLAAERARIPTMPACTVKLVDIPCGARVAAGRLLTHRARSRYGRGPADVIQHGTAILFLPHPHRSEPLGELFGSDTVLEQRAPNLAQVIH